MMEDLRRTLDAQLASGEIDAESFRRGLQGAFAPRAPRRPGRSYAVAAPLLASGELEGATLSRARWKKKSLRDARLAGVDLSHANLAYADLTGADLAGADLARANLQGAVLASANLSGAILTGANFIDADLTDATLLRADAQNLRAGGSRWRRTNAVGARLRYAALLGADFEEAKLAGARLIDADFDDSVFRRVDFSGASLAGASFENAKIEDCDFQKADAPRAVFNLAAVRRCNFSDANLTDVDAADSDWDEVILAGAKVDGASFTGGRLAPSGVVGLIRRRKWVALVPVLLAAAGAGLWAWRAGNPEHWAPDKFMVAAEERRQRLDFAGAESLYRLQLARFGDRPNDSAAARTALARLMLDAKRFDEADRYLREVIAEFPPLAAPALDAKIALADSLRERNRYDEAEAALLPLTGDFRGDPKVNEVWRRLIGLAKLRGDSDRLQATLEVIVKKHPELDPELIASSRLELAELARFRGDTDEAIEQYRRLATDPVGEHFNARALCAIVEIEGQRLDLAAANAALAELRRRFANDREIVLQAEISLASVLLGDMATAAEGATRLEKILRETNPPDKQFWAARTLIDYYGANGRPEQADAMLALLQKRFGADRQVLPELTILLVQTDLARGNARDALTRLNLATTMNATADQRRALAGLRARALTTAGELDAARAAYEALADNYPNSADAQIEALVGEAEVAAQAGRRPDAIALMRLAVQRDVLLDRRFANWERLAQMRGENGDADGERDELRDMVEQTAQWPFWQSDALMRLGDCYLRRHDRDQALAAYRQITTLAAPNRVLGALQAMLHLYAEAGDAENADRTLKELTERFPNQHSEQLNAQLETAEAKLDRGDPNAMAELQAIAVAGAPGPRGGALHAMLGAQVRQGQRAEAAATYAAIVAENSGNAETLANAAFVYADLLCGERDAEAVVKLLDGVAKENAGQARGRRAKEKLAQCWITRREFAKAAALLAEELGDPAVKSDAAERGRLGKLLTDVRLGEADALRENGASDRAVTIYRELLRQTSESADRARILMEVGRTAWTTRDFDGAREALVEALQNKGLAPEQEIDAKLMLGAVRVAQDKFDEAEKWYQDIAQAPGENWRLRFGAEMGLAEIAQRRGQYDSARQHCQRARKLSQDPASEIRAMVAVAELSATQRKFDDAAKLYEEILQRRGDDRAVRMDVELRLADLLAARGQTDKALAAYVRFAERYGAAGPTHQALAAAAGIYGARGDFAAALATMQEIDRRFPDDLAGLAATRLDYAIALKNGGRRPEAHAEFEKILAQYPRTPQAAAAEANLAQLDLDDGNLERAREGFRRLTTDFANDPRQTFRARLGLSGIALRQGRKEEAVRILTELTRAAADDQEKKDAGLSLANALRDAGKLDEADAEYERLLREFPDSPDVRYEANVGRGMIRIAQGRPNDGAALLQKNADSLRGQPREIDALRAWAEIEIDGGRFDRAETVLERLLKATPAGATIVAQLRLLVAERRVREGMFAEAARQLEAAEPRLPKAELPQLQRLRAEAAAGLHQFDKARQIYNAMMRDHAADAAVVGLAELGLADVLYREGKELEALQADEHIADRYGRARAAGLALLAIADIYEKGERPEMQDAPLRRLLSQVEPDRDLFPRARLGLADLDRQRRNFHAALGEYLSIAEEFPENDLAIWAKDGAAHVYYELGQDKDAEAEAKDVVANYPADHAAVVDAKNFLQQLYTRK